MTATEIEVNRNNWQDAASGAIHLTEAVMVPAIRYQLLHPAARIPERSYAGDAGYDLFVTEEVSMPSNGFADVHTGISVVLPPGVWARIVGRSSTIRRRGILVVEGIIDNGYRGELFISAKNIGGSMVQIRPGERIAQLVLQRIFHTVGWESVDSLPKSPRGDKGFGSSGL